MVLFIEISLLFLSGFSRGFLRLNFSNFVVSCLMLFRFSFTFLLYIPLLVTNVDFPQKNAGCQMQRCHAISRQGKLPKHSRPHRLSCLPTSTPIVCTGGQAYVTSEPKFLSWLDFPKNVTHGSPLARFARLSSAIKFTVESFHAGCSCFF